MQPRARPRMLDPDVRVVNPPERSFTTAVRIPGDKSLSHRALILAAMADGESRIVGLAPGSDVASTVRALRRFGVPVSRHRVTGQPWQAPDGPIDCGNSG